MMPQKSVRGVARIAGVVLGVAGVVVGVSGVAFALPAGCAQSGLTVTCTYSYTGAEQTFTVPDGVTRVAVTSIGAAGGDGDSPGGRGASVSGTFDQLTPGTVLYVEVGSHPGMYDAGPSFGGGGSGNGLSAAAGGGASDVRTVSGGADPSTTGLASRLIVAGGGGGGPEIFLDNGSSAGDAGADGGPIAVDGLDGQGGRAGTTVAGGAGGAGGNGGPAGGGGSLGRGGDGAQATPSGGGGGGGLYGGGGGGGVGNDDDETHEETGGGGGGGGSSLVPPGGQMVLSSAPASVAISYLVKAVASAIAVGSGDGQSALTGRGFAQPLVATVSDSVANVPVPGVTVGFAVTAGSATFAGGSTTATAVTNSAGNATAPMLTAGPLAGPVKVTATTPGVTPAATFHETVIGAVVVTAKPQTIVYGQPDPVFGYTVTGLNPGDSLTANPTCGVAGPHASVGSYPIACTGAQAGSNYQLSYQTGTFTVGKASVTVTARSVSKVYGAADPTFTSTVTGLLGSDRLTSAPTCSIAGTHSNVGTYPITCTGADAGGNYTITYVSGTLSITKAPTALAAAPLATTLLRPTATLTRADTGAVIGGETVSFTVGRNYVCSAVTNAKGVAQCSTTFLISLGVTATYAATTNYAGSSSTAPLL